MLGGIGMNNKAEYTPEKVVDISNLSREDCLEATVNLVTSALVCAYAAK